MSKRRSQSPVIPWVGGTLIWAYMSILAHTMRWRVEGVEHIRKLWDSPQGWVAATWHSRILLMPYIQIIQRPKWPEPPHPAALMVSPSKDGEFTKRAGTWLGLYIIRGSSSGRSDKNKRGVSAARECLGHGQAEVFLMRKQDKGLAGAQGGPLLLVLQHRQPQHGGIHHGVVP